MTQQTALQKIEERLIGRLVMTRTLADLDKFSGVDSRHLVGRRPTLATLVRFDDKARVWVRDLLAPDWSPQLVFLQTEVQVLVAEHVFGPHPFRVYDLVDHGGIAQSPAIRLNASRDEPDPGDVLALSLTSYKGPHQALKTLLNNVNLGAVLFRSPDTPHPDE